MLMNTVYFKLSSFFIPVSATIDFMESHIGQIKSLLLLQWTILDQSVTPLNRPLRPQGSETKKPLKVTVFMTGLGGLAPS